jgi:hypothetical protein
LSSYSPPTTPSEIEEKKKEKKRVRIWNWEKVRENKSHEARERNKET